MPYMVTFCLLFIITSATQSLERARSVTETEKYQVKCLIPNTPARTDRYVLFDIMLSDWREESVYKRARKGSIG